MKPTQFRNSKFIIAVAVLLLTTGLVSWDQQRNTGFYQQSVNDTTPKKKIADKKIRDLDDLIDELNNADLRVNEEEIRKQVEEAMKSVDAEKIKLHVEKAMMDVNLEKLKADLEKSMSKIDMEKLKKDLQETLKEFDAEKIQKEIRESMEKIDWDKMKEELNKVKEIDMKKIEEEMKHASEELKNLHPRLEKELAGAKEKIESAKTEMREFKVFVDGLEKDGLIIRKAGYNLKHKDGELFINGKKASAETYNKYRSFLEKHKKFSIEKTDDDFDIDTD